MFQFTYRLKIAERVKAKCDRHPRYNPQRDGRGGIKGGCSTCFTFAAQTLASRYGADPSAADWRRFGRLPGFTNCKPKYRRLDGFFPFVRLKSHTGEQYPIAEAFEQEITQRYEAREQEREARRQLASLSPRRGPRTSNPDSHRAWMTCLAAHPNMYEPSTGRCRARSRRVGESWEWRQPPRSQSRSLGILASRNSSKSEVGTGPIKRMLPSR